MRIFFIHPLPTQELEVQFKNTTLYKPVKNVTHFIECTIRFHFLEVLL